MNVKQAACLNCRKSKIKCRRDEGAALCERCASTGSECVIPEFHIGRQKGVKNKRSGLEKAIYQVEEAIKRRKSDTSNSRNTLEHLKRLLDDAEGLEGVPEAGDAGKQEQEPETPAVVVEHHASGHAGDDHLALEGVENPLQLLARASDLRIASPHTLEHSISTPGSRLNGGDASSLVDANRFFLPVKATLDQGPGLCPIEVGLVTLEEAEMLVEYYYKHLAHTRWGLDPQVHDTNFCRTRSAFLFTTILAMAAIFIEETAALAKRLLLHRRFLAEQVIVRKYRSVEIILAFMVSVPWMSPGVHASDDDTSMYLATSLSIALDLAMDKIITPTASFPQDVIRQIPKADCIHASKALAMDGFEDIDPQSEWGQKLLRRRERAWISLFVLERGVCLARGRSYCVPKTSLIYHCVDWPHHQYAYVQDGPVVSMAVLRRDLDDLFANVRTRCDNFRVLDKSKKVAEEIDWEIESFFDKWLETWTSVIGDSKTKNLPPYVEILVTHTRLSAYSMLLNHPSAPAEVKRIFRASALSSALNVMRAAIQGESRLKSMPNNTVTMICFAASIALTLSAPVPGKNGSQILMPSVRNLIEEAATVLERIGSTPSHRNGTGVVYGRFLRVLVKQAPNADNQNHEPQQDVPSRPEEYNAPIIAGDANLAHAGVPHDAVASFWPEPLDFSAMSYNEVNETVTNSDFFSTAMLDYPWDNSNPLMWTDWMNLPDFKFP